MKLKIKTRRRWKVGRSAQLGIKEVPKSVKQLPFLNGNFYGKPHLIFWG